MLFKNEIPVLEYDTEHKAVFAPPETGVRFPEKAILPFLDTALYERAEREHWEKVGSWVTVTKTFPIYRVLHHGIPVAVCQGALGASAAVVNLEYLIANGVREVIAVGSCGALTDLPENEFFIPTEALRDEGTSYRFLPPSRTVTLDERAAKAIKASLEKKGIRASYCKTWTTDGLFRETPEMVTYRKEEGCTVVDMECAGAAACARFRGITYGQILYTADSLADPDAYDLRSFGRDSESVAIELALDAVVEL